jgi:cyclophilin family peptidyl-prolyl cis-trans isomerase
VFDVEPVGCISFEMFANKVPEEICHTLSTVEKGLGYKAFPIHRIVPRFIQQGGTAHTILTLSASPSTGRNLKLITSS